MNRMNFHESLNIIVVQEYSYTVNEHVDDSFLFTNIHELFMNVHEQFMIISPKSVFMILKSFSCELPYK